MRKNVQQRKKKVHYKLPKLIGLTNSFFLSNVLTVKSSKGGSLQVFAIFLVKKEQ